jgi:glycosyltransferase involved in cell wall biosynthesis
MMDDLFEFVNKLKLSDFVKIIGYVDDSELIWLYRNCYANLYPSLYEGFGLPVLEGMQFGAPSIVSNSSSIPEVAEDACILIEPNDVEGWAMNMCALSKDSDIRNALVSKSIKQSKKYQWRYALKKVLEVYKKVTSLPKLIDER